LHIPERVIDDLQLEDQIGRVEELIANSPEYIRSSGRLLEYTVTREELPHTVSIIAAYLKGTAQTLGHPDIRLTPDDTLKLVLGGLTGSGIANLLDDIPGTPGERTLVDLLRRPDMVDVEATPVPLEESNHQLLYSTSDLVVALSGATVPALAVILKEGPESEDYERATQVISDGLQHYYHSPMSLLYRKQYGKHRKREEIKHQRELALQFGPQGYRLKDYVRFPEQLPKPTFPAEYDLPDIADLEACPRQMHYGYRPDCAVKDPDTDEEIKMPWFYKEEPYRHGPVVDELIADAFERGYMIVPLEWKENQAAGDLLHLWTTISLSSKPTPLKPEVGGTLMISHEETEFGRRMFFDFDDNTAGFGKEESTGFSDVVAEMRAAFSEMPEEALNLLKGGNKDVGWLEMAKTGNFYFMESYPRPFELMLAHLRNRVERAGE
jgi:hypothetical protein